jgi:hypothetical protein
VFSLLGIVGIIYATQVESLYRRGEYDAALASSRSAGKWAKVALWIVFGWIILLVAAIVALILFFGSIAAITDWTSNF